MAAILVTGMSGTGKSSVLGELARRGHRCVDTDGDAWCEWVHDERGEPDWVWRLDAVGALLDDVGVGHLFVSGCKSNQGVLYPRFDAVALLVAPPEVMVARVASRTTNPYGRSAEDRTRILRDAEAFLPRLRATATVELDGTSPLPALADALERLADQAADGVSARRT